MPPTSKVILLKGDPREPESAEHIIKFPGGSISVCRTSNNQYWVHVEVNRRQVLEDTHRESKRGSIVETRIDRVYPHGNRVDEIYEPQHVEHIAVRIKTEGE